MSADWGDGTHQEVLLGRPASLGLEPVRVSSLLDASAVAPERRNSAEMYQMDPPFRNNGGPWSTLRVHLALPPAFSSARSGGV